MTRHVYPFGADVGDDLPLDRRLLGGKGAGLAEMSRLGVPVPPGFTITTEACLYAQRHDGAHPPGLEEAVAEELERLESVMGRRLGEPVDPLLVSVRSGAVVSMPGMMDTVLNLGINDEVVTQWDAGERFALDCYRRLLTMYGDVVLGVPHRLFESELRGARREHGVETDAELPASALKELNDRFKVLIEERATDRFPQDPRRQLWGAIDAVFGSWDNARAREYRRLNDIADDLGTAVNVQVMVFGNRGDDCATGVAFTRDPGTGERRLYGEYLVNAQGEDVVAGIRTPRAIEGSGDHGGLGEDFPQAARRLDEVAATLEEHFRDMQDLEFTIDGGRLFVLQTRTGKRTGPAAVRIAVDMVDEGLVSEREAIGRIDSEQLAQLLAPGFDPDEKERRLADDDLVARGLPAGPGAASGRIALSAERAAEMAADGPTILVREETSPEDIVGMHAAVGILTARGGMTSHAAVVARGLGKPCVVGAEALTIDEEAGEIRVDGRRSRRLKAGDELSIDGTSGEVIAGAVPTRASPVLEYLTDGEGDESSDLADAFVDVLGWSDETRRLRVRANADTPEDARVARRLGAEGIGLCRTEHMFFDDERIPWVREMILATDAEERRRAIEHLRPIQEADFEAIFAAMDGLPVTVRLLDPPLHEFLPGEEEAIGRLADQLEMEPDVVADKVAALGETNPMLGHRGCRLGLTAPEIYDMQVEAIVGAACTRVADGGEPRVEIMLPLVGSAEECARLRTRVDEVSTRVQQRRGVAVDPSIGTMIEVPRACLVADDVAAHADFFSFGTNDLTQLTFGFSRDDSGRFLPDYLEDGILPYDPFARLDEAGVGALVATAVEKGRSAVPELKIGVCGEHGGEPHSIRFFDRVGLDYVSCSPYRVPIARHAAAHSRLESS